MIVFKAITEEIHRQSMAGLSPTTLRISRTAHDTLKQESTYMAPNGKLPSGDLERVLGLDVIVLDDFAVY